MDRNLKRIAFFSALILIFFGWNGLLTLWAGIYEFLIAFFPFFAKGIKSSIEDYLTSPYFLTGIVMFILSSGFGIWVGKTGGKIIYLIISVILALISLVSIGANLL